MKYFLLCSSKLLTMYSLRQSIRIFGLAKMLRNYTCFVFENVKAIQGSNPKYRQINIRNINIILNISTI